MWSDSLVRSMHSTKSGPSIRRVDGVHGCIIVDVCIIVVLVIADVNGVGLVCCAAVGARRSCHIAAALWSTSRLGSVVVAIFQVILFTKTIHLRPDAFPQKHDLLVLRFASCQLFSAAAGGFCVGELVDDCFACVYEFAEFARGPIGDECFLQGRYVLVGAVGGSWGGCTAVGIHAGMLEVGGDGVVG